MSWEVIIPFLRPIEPLLLDPEVTDILVNGPRVFAERSGRLSEVPGVTIPEKALQVAIRNIARVLGDDIGVEKPLLDARLPDGSRVAAVFPPCSVNGTTLAIRKFLARHFDSEELVRVGMMPASVLDALKDAVRKRHSMLISGRTGAGKTTLLNALAADVDDAERVIVIEDTAEIQIAKSNVVRLEARRAHTDLPAVTIRDLLRASLRLRPDRIVVGEIRGSEAFELLQALNTGHRGTLSTTHANSATESLERFAMCVLMSDVRISQEVLYRQIAMGLELLVHLDVRQSRRIVTEVARVRGYNTGEHRFEVESVYAA